MRLHLFACTYRRSVGKGDEPAVGAHERGVVRLLAAVDCPVREVVGDAGAGVPEKEGIGLPRRERVNGIGRQSIAARGEEHALTVRTDGGQDQISKRVGQRP